MLLAGLETHRAFGDIVDEDADPSGSIGSVTVPSSERAGLSGIACACCGVDVAGAGSPLVEEDGVWA